MRILPLAFVPEHTESDIAAVSALTHAHAVSKAACILYIKAAEMLLAGGKPAELPAMFKRISSSFPQEFERLQRLAELPGDDIKSSGYVVDTLEAALWCLLQTGTYRDCVLAAVHLGEDTDTTAAVAGGLAGIYYGCGGECGIPSKWIEQLARKHWIESLCRHVEAKQLPNC